jgi:hypothetical protein
MLSIKQIINHIKQPNQFHKAQKAINDEPTRLPNIVKKYVEERGCYSIEFNKLVFEKDKKLLIEYADVFFTSFKHTKGLLLAGKEIVEFLWEKKGFRFIRAIRISGAFFDDSCFENLQTLELLYPNDNGLSEFFTQIQSLRQLNKHNKALIEQYRTWIENKSYDELMVCFGLFIETEKVRLNFQYGENDTYSFITFYLRVLETIIKNYDLKPPLKVSNLGYLSPIQSIYEQFGQDTSLLEQFSKIFFNFNKYLQNEDLISLIRFDDNVKLQIDEQNGRVNFKILNQERDFIWQKNGMKYSIFTEYLKTKAFFDVTFDEVDDNITFGKPERHEINKEAYVLTKASEMLLIDCFKFPKDKIEKMIQGLHTLTFYQINRRVRFEEKNSPIPLYPCDLMRYTDFAKATQTFLPNLSLGEIYKLIDSFTFDISDKKRKGFSFDQFPLIKYRDKIYDMNCSIPHVNLLSGLLKNSWENLNKEERKKCGTEMLNLLKILADETHGFDAITEFYPYLDLDNNIKNFDYDFDLVLYKDKQLFIFEFKATDYTLLPEEIYNHTQEALNYGAVQLRKRQELLQNQDVFDKLKKELNFTEDSIEDFKKVNYFIMSTSYEMDQSDIGGFPKINYFDILIILSNAWHWLKMTAYKLKVSQNLTSTQKNILKAAENLQLSEQVDLIKKTFGELPENLLTPLYEEGHKLSAAELDRYLRTYLIWSII